MADDPQVVTVVVKDPWWSKINWTQAVGFACTMITLITSNRLQVSTEVQLAAVAAIQGITAFATIIMKTYFTPTVTPQSVTK